MTADDQLIHPHGSNGTSGGSGDRLLTDDLLLRDEPPARVLIRNGRVVSATGVVLADVLIEGGKVAAVRENLDASGGDTVVIDALGKHLLPGAIDLHVHFRDPLPANPAEDLRSGSRAAAAGGVTGFADMPNTDPPTITPAALAAKQALAAEKCAIDYSFYPTLGDADAAELGRYDRHAIPGFKAYMGGTTAADAMSEDDLHVTFAAAAELDVPVTVHAEDDDVIAENLVKYASQLDDPAVHPLVRDNMCCLKATVRAIGLARQHNAWLHVAHLTTAEEVLVIEEAVASGVRVTAEATLHHLLLNDTHYARIGNYLKCNPSVKSEADRLALWDGLRRGVIQMIASDNAPHPRESKERPYRNAPAGCVTIEFLMPLLLNEVNAGRMSLPELALWTADEPAELFGVAGKGRIEAGYDADIVVCDLERTRTITPESIRSACGHSPWIGETLKGWPVLTLLRGEPVFASVASVPRRRAHPRPLRFHTNRGA